MSEGLKFLGAVCETGSANALSNASTEMFTPTEAPAAEFVRQFLRRHGAMPSRQTVQAETGLALPNPREALSYYEEQLQSRHVFNQIRDRLQDFQDAFRSRRLDNVVQAVAGMHEAARMHQRRDRQVLNLREAGELVAQRLDDTRFTGGLTGALTGWERFDEITGGHQNSDITTFVARPGLGKTYLLLKQAHYSHQHDGRSVVFVTTEMGIEQIARRWASIQLGINPTLLKRNMISTYTQRRLARCFMDMVNADNFRIVALGMNAKVDALAAILHEYGPSIAYIDGIYLMQPSQANRNASRTERLTGTFDELKALNLEMNIPFVVTSQLNRQAGKGGKEGSLETIGYTDAIGTHSSNVIGVKPGPTDNPMRSRIMDFFKGREGETGEVAINFQFAPLNMDEIPYNPETGAPQTGGESEAPDQNWMV